MLGHEFSSRIASNNTYFIIGKQPFLRLDEFHVHQNSGHPINDNLGNKHLRCFPRVQNFREEEIRFFSSRADGVVSAATAARHGHHHFQREYEPSGKEEDRFHHR